MINEEKEQKNLEQTRRDKMVNWKEAYSFDFNSNCNINNFAEGDCAKIAGRIIFMRDLGKLIFGKLYDINGICQFSLSQEDIEDLKTFKKNLDIGDIVGVEGIIYFTSAGEKTIKVKKLIPLRKALYSLPEKWLGITNEETKIRNRYVDIITSKETRDRFLIRFKVIDAIKNFLKNQNFYEVETPILQNIASGAAANPFTTYYEALDEKMYLRIAPELFLKRLLIAGFDKVFEMGKCFRNEGIDPTHLQEFTMLEVYQTYISYEDLQDFAIKLLENIASVFSENLIVGDYDFNNIPRYSYMGFLQDFGGLNITDIFNEDQLNKAAKGLNLDVSIYPTHYQLLDAIYKHTCVKKVESPVLVFDYPKSPLAKISYKDSNFSDQFQIIINGQEVVKACLEMNDPDVQRDALTQQEKNLSKGDLDAVRTDYDFLEALMYGMPPAGGLGLGIDRILTTLTQCGNIRNIILFTHSKPKT
jgi:lysyl-tRNA synthetase class 2